MLRQSTLPISNSYQIRMNSHTINVPLRELLFIAPSCQERQEQKNLCALCVFARVYVIIRIWYHLAQARPPLHQRNQQRTFASVLHRAQRCGCHLGVRASRSHAGRMPAFPEVVATWYGGSSESPTAILRAISAPGFCTAKLYQIRVISLPCAKAQRTQRGVYCTTPRPNTVRLCDKPRCSRKDLVHDTRFYDVRCSKKEQSSII
jgi:hypothetical protein